MKCRPSHGHSTEHVSTKCSIIHLELMLYFNVFVFAPVVCFYVPFRDLPATAHYQQVNSDSADGLPCREAVMAGCAYRMMHYNGTWHFMHYAHHNSVWNGGSECCPGVRELVQP